MQPLGRSFNNQMIDIEREIDEINHNLVSTSADDVKIYHVI